MRHRTPFIYIFFSFVFFTQTIASHFIFDYILTKLFPLLRSHLIVLFGA